MGAGNWNWFVGKNLCVLALYYHFLLASVFTVHVLPAVLRMIEGKFFCSYDLRSSYH
jgi:hypothetical protein